MSTPTVRTLRTAGVMTVVIDRPEVRNAVDGPTASALAGAFREFAVDDSLNVAILTGARDTFCAGADLTSISPDDPRGPRLDVDGDAPLGLSRMLVGKPVIAAVEGHAVAGGLELALWCDLRVAAENAVFGVFCRRFGVPLMDGGTIRLPRLIGHGRALDLILTGRAVDATEARAIGLVDRVVPRGTALAAARRLAQELAALPQTCMRSDRLSVYEQWSMDTPSALRNETEHGLRVVASGETVAGAERFRHGEGRHGTRLPR
ncbi:MAG: crotonase/enoyl-CoA hydratase family protein [Chloroflexi bacterium]|nr:MAG: crotonase/enoyl-CoA hydratase family protein [Chloroflexota bacterium]